MLPRTRDHSRLAGIITLLKGAHYDMGEKRQHILFEYKSHCKKILLLDKNTPGLGTINSYNKTGKYCILLLKCNEVE